MLPNAPFWKRHGGECCESEGTVSVSMYHVRGQFLTKQRGPLVFDPRDHLTYNRIQLSRDRRIKA
jgi:hypothetical protein